MEKETLDKIKKKFLEYRNYRRNRQGEPWEITQAEWVEFFAASDERALILLRPRGISRLYRRNENLPWSLANVGISDKEIRRDSKHQFGIRRDADNVLSSAFNSFSVDDIEALPRTLTAKQWIAELRESADRY